MENERETDDEHVIAFGEKVPYTYRGDDESWQHYSEACDNQKKKFGISEYCRNTINDIKNNDPETTRFCLESENFSDLAWKLLGRYIVANDHLATIDLEELQLTDAKISLLFENLTGSSSLTTLKISRNSFGLDGIRSMVPFLNSASKLTSVYIGRSVHFDNECYKILIEALDGGPIEEVISGGCRVEGGNSIDDVTVLGRQTLPRLELLKLNNTDIHALPSLQHHSRLERIHLGNNKIGSIGFRPITDLLQNRSFSVKMLNLSFNNIGDKEVEILVESLKGNSTLELLELDNVYDFASFGAGAFTAILKLLNDMSSVNATYNSNHTLKDIRVPRLNDLQQLVHEQIREFIEGALNINRQFEGDRHAAGREKVVGSQLNSKRRKKLAGLQGIKQSYSSLLAGIDVLLLPNILALAGEAEDMYNDFYCWFIRRPQTELYLVLVAMAPYLASVQDPMTRKAKRKRDE